MGSEATASLRVAFWNTWLLAPRMWPGGPRVPFGEKLSLAPDVERRAPLVGRALAGRFDVAALAECFDVSDRNAVAAQWPEAERIDGPRRGRFKTTGSGLMTLVDRRRARVVTSVSHAYRSGGDWRDSDTFATKGALLVRVVPAAHQSGDAVTGGHGLPAVDVVSTHLIAGGDLFPIPGHDDRVRHHQARMAQVDELLAFIKREHDPAHVLLVMGDLNVAAHDPDPTLGDPTERYRDLEERFRAIGLGDVWTDRGIGPGSTCTFTDAAEVPPDPEDPDAVADVPGAEPATSPGERIDHLWLGVPDDVEVTVDRPRRWAFPRGAQGGPAGTLSDHLALSATIHLTAR